MAHWITALIDSAFSPLSAAVMLTCMLWATTTAYQAEAHNFSKLPLLRRLSAIGLTSTYSKKCVNAWLIYLFAILVQTVFAL
jgi:hypothetical protein